MLKKTSIIVRAVAIIGAMGAIAGGATYAASLTATATLSENLVSTVTPGLLVDGSDVDTTPTASEAGFSFTGLVPGGSFSTAQHFTLENSGDSALSVTVNTTAGTVSGGTLDKTKVHVKFTNGATTKTYTLDQLETLSTNGLPGISAPSSLAVGASQGIDVQVLLDADAISGGATSLSGFDFTFTGTAVE